MYEAYWGLHQSPFRGPRDTRFFFASPSHEEGLARLHFLVEQRRRLGLLLGVAGVGKSLLLQVLVEQLNRQGRAAIFASGVGHDLIELLWQFAARLGVNPKRNATQAELWRRITEQLAQHRMLKSHVTWIIDDADAASHEILAALIRIVQQEPHPESCLTVILACHNQRFRKLDPRLLDLADLKIEIEAWMAAETYAYVQESMRMAGAAEGIFQDEAIVRLHEATQGVPRKVARIADLALLAAAGQHLEQVDERTIDSVYHELCVS